MRFWKSLVSLWMTVALLLIFSQVAAVEAESMPRTAAGAVVTLLEGTPMLVASDWQRPLVSGEALDAGAQIQTDASSRVGVTLADGGILRLAHDTAIVLGAQQMTGIGEPITRSQVMLLEGRIWANFSHVTGESSSRVLVSGAMFYGGGSVFCAVVYPEGGVEVKSYAGQVTALGPFDFVMEQGGYTTRSAEEAGAAKPSWRHPIDAYRKLIVLASGAATKPFRFSAKSDRTDWVRWNQQRDGEGNN